MCTNFCETQTSLRSSMYTHCNRYADRKVSANNDVVVFGGGPTARSVRLVKRSCCALGQPTHFGSAVKIRSGKKKTLRE